MAKAEERRRYLRLSKPININFTLVGKDKILSTVSKNISAVGVGFETKEKLYTAVQSNLIKEYTSWMAIHRDTSKDLIDLITTAIREALSYMRGNRDFRRIGLWSYLESKERTSELDKRFTNSLIQAMRAGQEAGLVRDDIDAFMFPFVVRGTIEDWIRRESLRGEIFEETQNNNEITDEDLVDALVKLMLK